MTDTAPPPQDPPSNISDKWINQLSQPYTGRETRNLAANNSDMIPVGNNEHVEFIGFVFGLFVAFLFITILLSVIYAYYFTEQNSPYTEDDRDRLSKELRYSDFQYAASVGGALCIIGIFIVIIYFARWINIYNKSLLKQNAIAQDIAVGMRGGKAVDNVANLLATSVHPLDDETSQKDRERLRTTLKSGLSNSLQYESTAERGILNPDQGRLNSSYRMGRLLGFGRSS